ncbi:MAG: class I adenylate-forming enzyme family protein [Pseudomonadota bacterium]
MTIPLTIGRGIRCAAMRAPDKTAICFEGLALSYRELSQRIVRVANAARASGLERGSNVILLAPNCLEYFEIVAGLSDAGLTVVTANSHMTSTELTAVANDSQAQALFVHPTCTGVAEEADIFDKHNTYRITSSYDAWRDRASDSSVSPAVSDLDTFAISYTSGTTGQPKGIMLSHRSRALSFLAMATEYGCYAPNDHALAVAPLYHGGGFVFGAAPLFTGGTVTVLPSFDPEGVLSSLQSTNATSLFVVPTHVSALFALPHEVRDKYGYPNLKRVISNAAPLPQTAKEQLVDYFGEDKLFECYGSTEAGIVSNIHPSDILRKRDSVGLPFSCTEIQILDDEGQQVARGEPGVLYSRSPYLFNGYWQRPQETAEMWHEDWVTAGDLARQDEEGFLYVEGRKKDMILSGGVNIYPKEIENVIEEIENVGEAVVVGAPDAHWGEKVVAFIVRGGERDPDIKIIDAHCRAKLSNFKIPKEYRVVDEVPRNPTGKLLKRMLRDQL